MNFIKTSAKLISAFILVCIISIPTSAQEYVVDWITQHGGIEQDWSHAIATDSAGNVATIGYFLGTVDFDPGPAVVSLTSTGNYDVFIQKLDSNGNLLWVKNVGGINMDRARAVSCDSDGNVIAVVGISGTADLDPGPGELIFNATLGNMFVIKLDPNGDLVWAKQFQGTSYLEGEGIVINDSNDILITGYHNATADFDPGPGVLSHTTVGSSDSFVLKLDSNGDLVWVKFLGGVAQDRGEAIALDSSGAILCTGYFGGTADMDPSAGVSNLVSIGENDAYILKLDPNGNFLWVHGIGGTQSETGKAIACDSIGNVYWSGHFEGTVDLDPGPGVDNAVSGGSHDIFIQKYTPTGSLIWSGSMGSTGSDYSNSMVVDHEGSVYTTGAFQFTVDFDIGPAVHNVAFVGGHDIFIQKLDSSGNLVFLKQMGGTSYDYGEGITIDDFGSVLTMGYFRETADMDPGLGVNNMISLGGYDNYVLKLQECFPNTGIHTVAACDSFTWIDGITYTTSNSTAIDTVLNVGGCDSVVTLNLTMNYSSSGTDIQSACDSFTWIDGNTYTSSNNTATHIIPNSVGCDSIITLNLILNYSDGSIDSHIACNSFTWIDGNTYTASNTSATHLLTNFFGCDSIITLDLDLHYNTPGTDVQTACDSYTWMDGNTYTSNNNVATHLLGTTVGCDSLVTLDLTVNYSSPSTDIQSACDSYTWMDGNTYTSSNTTATHLLTTTAGCDSLVTLDLTVIYSSTSTDSHTACDNFTWMDGNAYTTSNTSATHVLTNAVGCDSIITLDLVINYSTPTTDVQSACDSFTWIDGNTYTSSNNSATYALANVSGCDSIITLDLTVNYSMSTIDVQTVCGNFTWINGVTYYADNNTDQHTLTTMSGCDSTVFLNLTIKEHSAITDSITVCDSYMWPVNNQTYTIGGVYNELLTTVDGCDSIRTLILTVTTIDQEISYSVVGEDPNNHILSSDQANATYQWVNCPSYDPINGENSQHYVATQNGEYAVILNYNGCTDTTNCFNVATISLPEKEAWSELSIYPNPTKNFVTVSLNKVEYKVFDVSGRLMLSGTVENNKIDFTSLKVGLYTIRVGNNLAQRVVKL